MNQQLTIFKCEEFEDGVNNGNDKGETEEIDVSLQESLFDCILK